MSDEQLTKCRGAIRSVAFGWNEYEGKREPQLVAKFYITEGDGVGTHETWFASLSGDKASTGKLFRDYTFESLRECGWTGTDDEIGDLPALVEAGKLANVVPLVIRKKQNSKGEVKTSIKYVGGGGSPKIDLKDKAMSPADVAAFARSMKKPGPKSDGSPF